MKVLLYFGSFNPIHNGHISLALSIQEKYDFDEIWFVVSPQNPLKQKNTLWDDNIRFELVKKALSKYKNFFVSDIEFKFKQPNYTANTLRKLSCLYPDNIFSLLIGEDNLKIFNKWYDYQYILDNYTIYVYPRHDSGSVDNDMPYIESKNIVLVDSELYDVSSTLIRNRLNNGESISNLVPASIENDLYQLKKEGRI